MKKRLLDFICCPDCKNSFYLETFERKGDEVLEGKLYCQCGVNYPVKKGVPRIIKNFNEQQSKLQLRTQQSFGYQWRIFSEMVCDFRENFLNYIRPLKEDFFKGKIGLDAGCGFGRHLYNAANFGAEMIGIDFSDAIDSSYENTKDLNNVHLVQADIYNLPFKEGIFDFIYSIGVLHHLPEPERGFKSLTHHLKSKGSIFIWVYSSQRKVIIPLLESVRAFTSKIPLKILKNICFIAAISEWSLLVGPYKYLKNKGLSVPMFSRVKRYSRYPFQVSFADWFDRLSAPIRFYYSKDDLNKWFQKVQLANVLISPTEKYGLRGYGEKQ